MQQNIEKAPVYEENLSCLSSEQFNIIHKIAYKSPYLDAQLLLQAVIDGTIYAEDWCSLFEIDEYNVWYYDKFILVILGYKNLVKFIDPHDKDNIAHCMQYLDGLPMKIPAQVLLLLSEESSHALAQNLIVALQQIFVMIPLKPIENLDEFHVEFVRHLDAARYIFSMLPMHDLVKTVSTKIGYANEEFEIGYILISLKESRLRVKSDYVALHDKMINGETQVHAIKAA